MIFIFLYTLVLAEKCTAVGATSCPDTWVADRQSCYLFSIDQRSTFIETQHYCGQHGGHLVIINDKVENLFLRSFVKKLRASSWWIGLTDELVEGDWRWTTSEVPGFTDWAPNEPNSYGGHHDEDCGVMHDRRDYHWVDDMCSLTNPPICEMETDTIPVG